MYKTKIRTLFDYAAPFWNESSDYYLRKLDNLQHDIITTMYNFWPSTPRVMCEFVSQIPPKTCTCTKNNTFFKRPQINPLLKQCLIVMSSVELRGHAFTFLCIVYNHIHVSVDSFRSNFCHFRAPSTSLSSLILSRGKSRRTFSCLKLSKKPFLGILIQCTFFVL